MNLTHLLFYGRNMAKKMQKLIKYVIFDTKWGYFGLSGTKCGLCRTELPNQDFEKIKSLLLRNIQAAQFDRTLFKKLQEQIISYYQGSLVNFRVDIPLVLDEFSPFGISVLSMCRNILFGQTTTYGRIAKMIGRPAASRAVGGILARNPLPLIIPCHRIIRGDGKLGGFSAPGGVIIKQRMLELELNALSN